MLLLVNDNISNIDISAAMPFLSQQRYEKIQRLAGDNDKRASIAAYMLLCEALKNRYAILDTPIFEYGTHGKPFLKGYNNIHFSMSHCNTAAVCAVADFPIGVDVEHLRPYNERLASYTMNEEEYALISSSASPEVDFIRLWTMKEAVVKLSGRGINDIKNILTNFSGKISYVERLEKGYIYSVAHNNL